MQGKSISGYTLQRLLGTGGMAEVWYAENKIGKKAAVKLLLPKLCQDENVVSRFLTEAKVMVDLNHPNIRQVYDYGDIDGRPAIVMEYLDGSDLKARLKRGQRFTQEELVKWWNQLVDALNYTHQKGIVHRDIKPGNVFIDQKGDAKLLDFGIAKLTDTSLGTLTGSTLGTRIYMSPEQVKDPKRVGPASDVYSLVVSFVHLLTGKAPYDSTTNSDFDIQFNIVSKPLDLKGVSLDWRNFLESYLTKDPQQRPKLKHFPQTQLFVNDENEGTMAEGVGYRDNPRQQTHHIFVPKSDTEIEQTKPKNVKNRLWMIASATAVMILIMLLFVYLGGKTSGNEEVMDALNANLQTTNITLSNQINQKYAAFEEQYGLDQEKVGPYWEQAQALREEATDLIDYVETLKWDLVKKIECDKAKTRGEAVAMALERGLLKNIDTLRNGRRLYDINTSKIKSRDNYNKPTAYMMGDPEGPSSGGKAYELSEKIRRFRGEVVKAVGFQHIHEIGLITDSIYGTKAYLEVNGYKDAQLKRLPVEGEYYGAKVGYYPGVTDLVQDSWEYHNFHHTALVADVALLNKIISEAQTAELNAVTQMMTNIHATDFTYDEFGAKVFAESGYLLSGQTYKAQAMVTAWKNSQLTARVKLDGGAEREYVSNAQGVIPLEWNVGVGSHNYTGVIDMLDPSTNQIEEFPFTGSFVVAPPAVSVSATKMNVVYRGIDNPISVGGGVGGEINATASSGTLSRTGNGTYILRPSEASEVTINVTSGGSNLGSMKFRVKDLPKPTPVIRNVVNGVVSKSALLAANRVEAEMKDFDLNGVHYDVVSYTFRYKTKSGAIKEVKASSGAFNNEIKNVISQSNVGDMFVFTAIQVRGNDGKVKTLDVPIGVGIK